MTNIPVDQLLLDSYRSWLLNRQLSPSTVKNYTSDLKSYFQTLKNENPFSYSPLNAYLQQIYADSNSPRYLASLNLFCQFGLDQKLITQNPLSQIKQAKKTQDNPDVEALITKFSQELNRLKTPPSTVKNYINDLYLYLRWLENSPPPNAT